MMSEYFVGQQSAGQDPFEPPLPGEPSEPSKQATGATDVPLAPGESAQVRFGIPFNGVVPIWHEGTAITWHRPLDGTDLATVLGLGLVEDRPGPSPVPDGWSERVDVGVLTRAADRDSGLPDADPLASTQGVQGSGEQAGRGEAAASNLNTVLSTAPFSLRLRAAAPTGRRAINDPGDGAVIPLSAPLTISEAMGLQAQDFDITAFSVHVGRLMLRAARDRAILLFTLRAPHDPEAHHLLSIPSEVDEDHVMHFHLGTLLDMETPSWEGAQHSNGMTLLDVDAPYHSLLADPQGGEESALDVEKLIECAQPVVDAILQPGFPFALGSSVIVPA